MRTVLSGPSTGVVGAIGLARADHFAFDIAQNRGCDPVDAVQIEAANGLGGPREKIGRDFAGRAGPALDRQAPDCVEPGPERQQQHRQGTIGRRLQVVPLLAMTYLAGTWAQSPSWLPCFSGRVPINRLTIC